MKLPCKIEDYSFNIGACVNGTRMLNFMLIEPTICSDQVEGAIEQPESTLVPCRGCGRGESRNEEDECVPCQDGYYQDKDNHMEENGTLITACKKCPAGHYAPKVHDFGHFEELPPLFYTACSISSNIGDSRLCSVSKGWHSNTNLNLDSNGDSSGIPQGLKFSLKAYVEI